MWRFLRRNVIIVCDSGLGYLSLRRGRADGSLGGLVHDDIEDGYSHKQRNDEGDHAAALLLPIIIIVAAETRPRKLENDDDGVVEKVHVTPRVAKENEVETQVENQIRNDEAANV